MSPSRTTAVLALTSVAVLGLGRPTLGQDVGDPAKGLAYARQVCADCHGVLAQERVSPRFNVATFKRIAETPGMTAQALSIWLTSSHPTMPMLVLEDDDKRNVIAYIVGLKGK